ALFAACAAPVKPYDPFRAPRDEIRAVSTIALVSAVLIPSPNRDALLASIESLATAKLVAAGFTVLPTGETERLGQRAVDQIGGYFDPKTGKPDPAKQKAVFEFVRRELRASHHADAMLFCDLGSTIAKFQRGIAYWNGMSEDVSSGGFWNNLAASDWNGNVAAASVYASLQDLEGRVLYYDAGGIEILSHISDGQFVDVPENERLTHPERIVRAVDIALGPLVQAKSGTAAP